MSKMQKSESIRTSNPTLTLPPDTQSDKIIKQAMSLLLAEVGCPPDSSANLLKQIQQLTKGVMTVKERMVESE